MSLVPPRGQRLLPTLSGIVMALAFPPFRLLLPSFLGLVPLLVFIAERAPDARGRWEATRGAMLAGLIYFGLTLYWLVIALIYYSALAVPAYLGTILVLTGFSGAFGWAVHYTLQRTRVPLPVIAAAFWTALEWVQGNLADLSFPWLGLGTSLAGFPSLAGAADLVGARGLTVWLAAVNGVGALAIVHRRAGRRIRGTVGVLAALVAVPIVYGVWRDATLEMRPTARVAVVQPNIPEDLKMDSRIALDTSFSALANLTGQIRRGSVDLVAWPEVALPTVIQPGSEGRVELAVRGLSLRAGAPILVGAYDRELRDGDATYFNSAFYVTPDSITTNVYSKRFLVPFVERVPFVDPDWLESVTGDLRWFGGLGRGRSLEPMGREGAEFGVLICYESIFQQQSRRFRNRGADFLVNMTNDAWYGREDWYARTSALWQHPSHLVLRAIENRMGVARPANTGISMYVDPRGRTYEETELFGAAVRSATVYTTDERTLYTRWGDWLATAATLAALAMLVGARVRP